MLIGTQVVKIIMYFPTTKLKRIEQEIIEKKKVLVENGDKALSFFTESKYGIGASDLKSAIELSCSETRLDIERLESERGHILDARDSLFWRFLWNVITPILVSIITTLVITRILYF